MKTVAFVPIKLNSQRLPKKNILPIAGHPLCWHVVNTLLQIKGIDKVYIYCSDERVMQYLPQGAVFMQRDKRLDGDLIKGYEIYRSFLDEVDADTYLLAHTTSPFVSKEAIKNALNKVVYGEYDSAFSAKRIQTFAWYENTPINYSLEDVPRTQDIEPIWVETSGFYIFKKSVFTENKRRIGFNPYIQEVSDVEGIDIDEKKDYDFACYLANQLNLCDETE